MKMQTSSAWCNPYKKIFVHATPKAAGLACEQLRAPQADQNRMHVGRRALALKASQSVKRANTADAVVRQIRLSQRLPIHGNSSFLDARQGHGAQAVKASNPPA